VWPGAGRRRGSEDHWGGRIESQRFELGSGDHRHDFIAEFGPMRFEADLQVRLRRLCFHLGIAFRSFSPTTAPLGTTHYELTEIEESFDSVTHLLEWAVLRMFFEHEVKGRLKEIESDRGGKKGPRQFAALRRYMDEEYFCDVHKSGKTTKIMALDDARIQEKLECLREHARLRAEPDAPRLAELGLWNALSEVISPGALGRIRDSGTFYHFIAQNPSALEWGIFWLRQTSVVGDLFRFTRETAPEGTQSLADQLYDRIGRECRSVRLSPGHEVVRVEHGKRPDEVALRVTCRDPHGRRYSFNQRADHVILALPQQPLRELAEQFPSHVLELLESVAPMPLLKAFLVTRKPWWRPHLKAQTYAWLVPTRELHFFRPDHPDCLSSDGKGPDCICEARVEHDIHNNGMIMLYTDEPAIKYWQALMTPEQRREPNWIPFPDPAEPVQDVSDHPNGLLASLIRRLLMIPDPQLARNINVREGKIMAVLERDHAKLAASVGAQKSRYLKLAERIFKATEKEKDRKQMEKVLRSLGIELDEEWRDWLQLAIGDAEPGVSSFQRTKDYARRVRAYGIRDWSAAPFGGASHVWLPIQGAEGRHRPEELIAFPLRGRAEDVHPSNVHICGEAYSGFQGFIEGALRTAEEVVESIAGHKAPDEVFAQATGLKAREKEWGRQRAEEIREAWGKLEEEAVAK
jgi:hypothetical protein